MIDQQQRVKRLIFAMLDREPFFAHLVLSMRLVFDDPICDTMATDGRTLHVNTTWSATLSDEHVIGVLAHEAMHKARMHMVRRGDRKPEPWNIACDAVINRDLRSWGYDLPANGADEVFLADDGDDMTEEVYDRLMEKQREYKMPLWGQCLDAGDLSDDEIAEMQKDVIQAAAEAREAGKMPAEFETILTEMFQGQRDWRDDLRKYLGGGTDREQTWSRPNRRFIGSGQYLPGYGDYGVGEIVLAGDSSGSVDDKLFARYEGEVNKINEDLCPEKIHAVVCDARVQWTETFTGYDSIKFKLVGRGGTDFRPVFDWVKQQGIQPKALIYFTDLYGPFPKEAPDYPVLWVVWPGGDTKAPPFGDVIRMGA